MRGFKTLLMRCNSSIEEWRADQSMEWTMHNPCDERFTWGLDGRTAQLRLKPEERVLALKIVQGCACMLPGICGQISDWRGWAHIAARSLSFSRRRNRADGEPEVIYKPSGPAPINLRVPACTLSWLRHSRVGARATTGYCWSWSKHRSPAKYL